ncbi:MAG: divalent-cation tolerance protein CutA [Zoogloeaceae bacterium]|jgi:periplasmic divalent cation tolerance protein|nr:divalent-cation tolerance protein CutA [Zoogloeaceae bacterium]
MKTTSSPLLVITHLPDAATAERLATLLVENGLAACVNLLAPCRSVYRWQGRLETAAEIPLFIKTRADRYEALQTAIRDLHPYDLPEIIALPIIDGLPAYLDWVHRETEPPCLLC